MADEPLERVSKMWDKMSETVVKGLKTGKEELLRTSRMGKIRLEISSIKNRIESTHKELGGEVYKLWLAKKAGIAELEGTFAEIKRLEEQIEAREKEIERLVGEREEKAAPLAEVKPLRPTPKVEEPPAEPQAKKPVTKRKRVKKAPPKKTRSKKSAPAPVPETDAPGPETEQAKAQPEETGEKIETDSGWRFNKPLG